LLRQEPLLEQGQMLRQEQEFKQKHVHYCLDRRLEHQLESDRRPLH
jgi:hypothetical protein